MNIRSMEVLFQNKKSYQCEVHIPYTPHVFTNSYLDWDWQAGIVLGLPHHVSDKLRLTEHVAAIALLDCPPVETHGNNNTQDITYLKEKQILSCPKKQGIIGPNGWQHRVQAADLQLKDDQGTIHKVWLITVWIVSRQSASIGS